MASFYFSGSSDIGRTLLDREIIPIGKASSLECTEFMFGEGQPVEEASSPSLTGVIPPNVSLTVVVNSKKRENPSLEPLNPESLIVSKNTRRNKYYPISYREYSCVLGEVANYISENNTKRWTSL